jgi:hypothetical protein
MNLLGVSQPNQVDSQDNHHNHSASKSCHLCVILCIVHIFVKYLLSPYCVPRTIPALGISEIKHCPLQSWSLP